MQHQLDDVAINHPRSNDYWEEMLCPVCHVIDVTDTHVMAKWWDKEKPVVMSRSRFKTRLSYGSIPGTWANVHRDVSRSRLFQKEQA